MRPKDLAFPSDDGPKVLNDLIVIHFTVRMISFSRGDVLFPNDIQPRSGYQSGTVHHPIISTSKRHASVRM